MRKLNLRVKTGILFFIVTLLPFLLGGLVIINRTQALQTEQVFKVQQDLTEKAAQSVEENIDQNFNHLDQLDPTDFSPDSKEGTKTKALSQILKLNPDFLEISYINPNGQEETRLSKYQVVSSIELVNFSTDPRYLQMIKNSRQMFLNLNKDNQPILTLSYRLMDQKGGSLGLILATLNPELQKVIEQIKIGATGEAYLVSSEGIVVAHKNPKFLQRKEDFSGFCSVQSFKTHDNKQCQYKNAAGVEVLGLSSPISYITSSDEKSMANISLGIITEWPVEEALGVVFALRNFITGLLIIVTLLSLTIGVWASLQIINPIEALQQGAKIIGKGNLNYRLNIHTGDEIEDLATEFNQMATTLEHNVGKLTYQNRLLTALRNLDQATLSSLEIESLSQFIVDLISQELGYMFGTIALLTPDGKGIKRMAISKTQNQILEKALETVPVPFKKQVVPITAMDNLLVKVITEKRSYSTNSLYDIQKGMFEQDVAEKIQQILSVKKLFVYPLVAKNRVLGIIYYASTTEQEVTQVEFAIMEEFTSEVARAIDNALLYQESQKNLRQITEQNKLFTALRRLDLVALSSMEVDDLCQGIVDLVIQELPNIYGTISLIDEKEKVLRRAAISHHAELNQVIANLPIPLKQQAIPLTRTDNLAIRAINERRPFYTPSLYDVQRGFFSLETSQKTQESLQATKFHSIYVYPLITKDRVIGEIHFLSSLKKEEVNNTQLAIMDEYSRDVARVLDNALLYQSLKQDKEVISAERNKIQIALANISDAVIAVDLQSNIIIFNKAAEELTGYQESQVLGKPIDQAIRVVDKEKEISSLSFCPIRKDGYEGVVFSQRELKIIGNHKEAYANVISGQIKEGLEVNLGCIITMHDVTKEKELEEMKLDFVSMASHQLRTPLTSIIGYMSVFIEENKKKLDQEQQGFLNRIFSSAKQMVTLVENLLNISRIEEGRLTTSIVPIDWPPQLNKVMADLQNLAQQKNITLTLAPSGSLPKVFADPLLIHEVLSNLTSNAIKYTQAGGKVEISAKVVDNEMITTVSDNGMGIPQEAIPHLFTKFFRVSKKLENEDKGTGLGLYIAKSIVDRHKGRIWAESNPGQGSKFSFSLSIAPNSFVSATPPKYLVN